MIKRLKCMYKAGRNGQPMPPKADRTVGETAAGAAITVGTVFGVVFAIGAATAASERLFSRTEQISFRVVDLDNAKDADVDVK